MWGNPNCQEKRNPNSRLVWQRARLAVMSRHSAMGQDGQKCSQQTDPGVPDPALARTALLSPTLGL